MKKSKSHSRPASTRKAPTTVDEYFARVPEPARSRLSQVRAAIRSVVPSGATETISYQIPAFKHDGVLVWYAAFADHVSLFPASAVMGTFKDELKEFRTSKGTIQFPLGEPMPIALIKKIVRARVAQTKDKKRR